MWRFCVTNQSARACLEALLPYLRIKRGQAENAIACANVNKASQSWRFKNYTAKGPPARSEAFTALLDAHYDLARSLNRYELNAAYHALIAARTKQMGLLGGTA